MERALEDLGRVPPAVQGQGGRQTLFRAIALIWNDYGFDDAECHRILGAHYNPRCSPPWSDRELAYEVREAVKRHRFGRPRGSRLYDGESAAGAGRGRLSLPPPADDYSLPDFHPFTPSEPDYSASSMVVRYLSRERGIPRGFARAMLARQGSMPLLYPSRFYQWHRPFVRVEGGRIVAASHQRERGLEPLSAYPFVRMNGDRIDYLSPRPAPGHRHISGAWKGEQQGRPLAYYRITDQGGIVLGEKPFDREGMRTVRLYQGVIVNAIFPLYEITPEGLTPKVVGENRRRVMGSALTSDKILRGNPKYGAWVFPALSPATREIVVTEAVLDAVSASVLDRLAGRAIGRDGVGYTATNGSAVPILLMRYAKTHGITLTLAMDDDKAGKEMSAKITRWCAANGVRTAARRPPHGKDWNDSLSVLLARARVAPGELASDPDFGRRIGDLIERTEFQSAKWLRDPSAASPDGARAVLDYVRGMSPGRG